ncbi:hypothetical protein [Agrococcus baldri]|uniref:hypothetical protein n=1 Tax=Agrococcus baldri TaxID=153730 RepID=UPI0011BDB421|nr:hypothetical protein [Agrococcus baldri]
MHFTHECEADPVDEQPEREPASSADAEARRRTAVLAELRRRRNRRRWIVGLSTVAVTALIAAGSVIAWSSQARAGDLAGQIDAWHEEHDRASCELAVRIVSAVGLERRAQDVLDAAEHVGGASWLLPAAERDAFAADRDALLRTIADGGFVTDEDRELADTWEDRAAASGDPESYDVLGECITAAAAEREPIEGVTAERADALARELRALGDPRDFDDARIDRLEAAIAQLQVSATATAEGRTAYDALKAELGLAPEQALASLRESDQHLAAVLGVLRGTHTPSDVLDLVESITLHLASAWMAEAWQLEAQGEADAAAELANAAQQTRDAIANAAPRPVTDPGTSRPTPVVPPREEAPVPVDPAPVDPRPTRPAPTTPPTQPTTPPTQPTEPVETPAPEPTAPPVGTTPPTEPAPEPEPEPEQPDESSEPAPSEGVESGVGDPFPAQQGEGSGA